MFTDMLRRFVEQCPGAVGAVLMGYDGIAVDQYYLPVERVDLGMVAVEYANVLKEIRNAAEILKTGELREVSIVSKSYQVLIRTLGDEYFIGLTLKREGNAGKGRYLLLRDAPEIQAALA
ncbi:roadblock/LC7 domain-containing protein [Geoalkalibacter subterraneus]|jgi:predicted regulator of Ras-like GTPase activity (Roadblock/LC7/MglB family)|uniref:GTPase n=1 Tax=Geoalkalibacter subterraneus TaxID=483547 RepID=A0A0B5FD52_9BACT|nr:roadblock/LC7 domain-containing protein [Geoalkalibacter subterraneus]AJF06062.1 GTPase [Geoalkalibacter subterraneus]